MSKEDREALDILRALADIAAEALSAFEAVQFILALEFGVNALRCNMATGFVSTAAMG